MSIAVRLLRPAELPLYLEIIAAAIHGLAASHYSPEAIEGWAPKITDRFLAKPATNADGEIRLIAEVDGVPAGIGALVVGKSELRACYVLPSAARRGCGSALVREIERLAKEHSLSRLELAGSLNAESFYASLGYEVRERSAVALPNGHRLPCAWMEKALC